MDDSNHENWEGEQEDEPQESHMLLRESPDGVRRWVSVRGRVYYHVTLREKGGGELVIDCGSYQELVGWLQENADEIAEVVKVLRCVEGSATGNRYLSPEEIESLNNLLS